MAATSEPGSTSVGCAMTSSSPTAETITPATRTTCRLGVGIAGQEGPVYGELEAALRDPGDRGEVKPPQRGGREEGHAEGHDPGGVQLEVRGRGTRENDRLAERDDDEELEAFGKVLGADGPGFGRNARQTGDAERHQRPHVVERERQQPQRDARLALDQRA